MNMKDLAWIVIGAAIGLAILFGLPYAAKPVRWLRERPPYDKTGWTIAIGLAFIAAALIIAVCKLHI